MTPASLRSDPIYIPQKQRTDVTGKRTPKAAWRPVLLGPGRAVEIQARTSSADLGQFVSINVGKDGSAAMPPEIRPSGDEMKDSKPSTGTQLRSKRKSRWNWTAIGAIVLKVPGTNLKISAVGGPPVPNDLLI